MKYDVEIAIQILEDAEAKPFDHAVVNGGMRNPFYKINNLVCSKKKVCWIFWNFSCFFLSYFKI